MRYCCIVIALFFSIQNERPPHGNGAVRGAELLSQCILNRDTETREREENAKTEHEHPVAIGEFVDEKGCGEKRKYRKQVQHVTEQAHGCTPESRVVGKERLYKYSMYRKDCQSCFLPTNLVQAS